MKAFQVLIATCALLSASAVAQCAGMGMSAKTDAPKSGFRSDLLKALDDLEKKSVGLAEAAPQEKYSWRPAEGVRSVGEVFTHMAMGNYYYAGLAGNKAPADINVSGIEKLGTDKTNTVSALKQSFVHVRQTILQLSDADLEKPVKMGGGESTVRYALFIMEVHQSEHLGQSIAYARSIGVVPPWTAERQAAQKKKADHPKK